MMTSSKQISTSVGRRYLVGLVFIDRVLSRVTRPLSTSCPPRFWTYGTERLWANALCTCGGKHQNLVRTSVATNVLNAGWYLRDKKPTSEICGLFGLRRIHLIGKAAGSALTKRFQTTHFLYFSELVLPSVSN